MQIVFVDTPGIHAPKHKLGQFLNQEAEEGLNGVDLGLFLVDLNQERDEDDQRIANLLRSLRRKLPLVMGMNKVDLVTPELLEKRREAYQSLLPQAEVVVFSAVTGQGLEELIEKLGERLPIQEAEFPEDQLTDLYEREIAADLIREAALISLRDEVPHGLNVRIDDFKERSHDLVYIHATIFVERDSQKGIVIGEGGKMLKKIGTSAREEIEKMGGRKVFLELRAKVEKNWRNREDVLSRFGYKLKQRRKK